MAKKKNRSSDPMPPCPDPERYTLVRTREGVYWRLKRGSVKPVKLNKALTKEQNTMKLTSPAASRMVHALNPFLAELDCGRITVKFSALLRKGLDRKKITDLSFFRNADLQRDYPLDSLLLKHPDVIKKGKRICIQVPVGGNKTIVAKNKLVDGYQLCAVMLYGDIMSGEPLKTASAVSPAYRLSAPLTDCKLWLNLPLSGPWLLFLKVSCFEEGKAAFHPKHYGMRVVAVEPGLTSR